MIDDIIKNIEKIDDQLRYEDYPTAIADLNSVYTELLEFKNRIEKGVPKESIPFKNITEKMLKTYIEKNHDYGNSFNKSMDKFGMIASIIRMGDKMNRLESLVTKDNLVKDESIKDTLLDLANYAILTIMWLNEKQ